MSSLPKRVDDLLDRLFAKGLVTEVAGDGQRLAAFFLDDCLGLGGVAMLAQIKDRDVGAFAGE